MIGAGTGVAPYRAFLEEREELEIEGKHGSSLVISILLRISSIKRIGNVG